MTLGIGGFLHPVPAVLRKDKAMKKTIMKKYANLLIQQGVNIKKGQELVIVADVEAAPELPGCAWIGR